MRKRPTPSAPSSTARAAPATSPRFAATSMRVPSRVIAGSVARLARGARGARPPWRRRPHGARGGSGSGSTTTVPASPSSRSARPVGDREQRRAEADDGRDAERARDDRGVPVAAAVRGRHAGDPLGSSVAASPGSNSSVTRSRPSPYGAALSPSTARMTLRPTSRTSAARSRRYASSSSRSARRRPRRRRGRRVRRCGRPARPTGGAEQGRVAASIAAWASRSRPRRGSRGGEVRSRGGELVARRAERLVESCRLGPGVRVLPSGIEGAPPSRRSGPSARPGEAGTPCRTVPGGRRPRLPRPRRRPARRWPATDAWTEASSTPSPKPVSASARTASTTESDAARAPEPAGRARRARRAGRCR